MASENPAAGPFVKGEKIVCVDNKREERWLTSGKEYVAQEDEDTSGGRVPYLPVLDDVGDMNWVMASRFTRVPAPQPAVVEYVRVTLKDGSCRDEKKMDLTHCPFCGCDAKWIDEKMQYAEWDCGSSKRGIEPYQHTDCYGNAELAALRTRCEQAEQRVGEIRRELEAERGRANKFEWLNEKENGKWIATRDANKVLQAEVTALKEKLEKAEEENLLLHATVNQGAEAQGERWFTDSHFDAGTRYLVFEPGTSLGRWRTNGTRREKTTIFTIGDALRNSDRFTECHRDGTPLTEPAKPATEPPTAAQ